MVDTHEHILPVCKGSQWVVFMPSVQYDPLQALV